MIRLFVFGLIMLNFMTCSYSDALLKQNGDNLVVKDKNGDPTECETLNLSFIIVSNELRSENLRHIQVFMRDSAFSIENLKKLSSSLSDKFPNPKFLTVVAYTDWSQLDLPTSCEGSGISGGGERPDKNEFHWGVFNRHGKNQTIRYLKTPKTNQLETVVLK